MDKNEDKELVQKILDASNHIHNAGKKSGNFVVCGAGVARHMKEVFEEIEAEEKKEKRNKKIDDLLNGEE